MKKASRKFLILAGIVGVILGLRVSQPAIAQESLFPRTSDEAIAKFCLEIGNRGYIENAVSHFEPGRRNMVMALYRLADSEFRERSNVLVFDGQPGPASWALSMLHDAVCLNALVQGDEASQACERMSQCPGFGGLDVFAAASGNVLHDRAVMFRQLLPTSNALTEKRIQVMLTLAAGANCLRQGFLVEPPRISEALNGPLQRPCNATDAPLAEAAPAQERERPRRRRQ